MNGETRLFIDIIIIIRHIILKYCNQISFIGIVINFYVLIILSFLVVASSHLRVMEMVGMFHDAFENVLNEIVVLNNFERG